MPAFIMPLGDIEAVRSFNSLDAFTRGYVEAMFFTETGYMEDEELEDASFEDLSQEAINQIVDDCKDFQESFADLLSAAYERDYGPEQAGHDFWLTRNRHSAGFWDRGALYKGELGRALTDASHPYGEVYLYRGDDTALYLM
jgi:hypothetical protein